MTPIPQPDTLWQVWKRPVFFAGLVVLVASGVVLLPWTNTQRPNPSGARDASEVSIDALVERLALSGLPCQDLEAEAMITRLTKAIATCELPSEELTLYVFSDNESRDAWRAQSEVFGPVLIGDRWVAKPYSMRHFEAINEALKGDAFGKQHG